VQSSLHILQHSLKKLQENLAIRQG